MSCESFEILVERERHGAISAEERADLDAHLKTCEPCRVYVETAERARRGLAAMVKPDVDWTTLEARLRGAGRARLRRTLLLAGIGPVAIALSFWGLATSVEHGLTIGAVVTSIVGARVVTNFLRERRLAQPAGGEFFGAHREELARQIRRLTILRWVALAVVSLLVALAIGMHDLTIRGRIAYFVLAAIAAAVWMERLVVGLPALRREHAMLERALR